jgi:hypothetical protein
MMDKTLRETVELFVDDECVSCTDNVETRVESPDRLAEPIVVPEYPWESCGVTLYGSVLREDDRFRMWYMAMGENGSQTMCHAESEDGLVWHKTMMDHIPYGDHRQTNIVLGPDVNIHGPCVLRNPDPDDLDRSYLVFYDSYSRYRPEIQRVQSEDRWTYTASSPDGLHWTPAKGIPAVPGKSDTGQSVVWDPGQQRFLAYMRGVMMDQGGHRVRYVRLSSSTDFETWTPAVELLRAETSKHQFHQFSVTRCRNLFIGLLSIFHVDDLDVTPEGVPTYTSRPYPEVAACDTWLTVSRDGVNWKRVGGDQALLALCPGRWDGMFLCTASQCLFHDEQVWIYYAGKPTRQGEDDPSLKSIGLARLPRDRFASLAPRSPGRAMVELKPMVYGSLDLALNARALDGGRVLTELCDMSGSCLEGFSAAECIPMTSDALAEPVRWSGPQGTTTLADAADRAGHASLRVRFYLEDAHVYAWQLSRCQP